MSPPDIRAALERLQEAVRDGDDRLTWDAAPALIACARALEVASSDFKRITSADGSGHADLARYADNALAALARAVEGKP